MEIAEKTRERSTVILAVVSLVIIGLTVLLYTLQTFRHQRAAEEQHLFITSRAVYLSIERTVRRGPVRAGENRLSPRASELFQTLEQDGDILFVGIVGEHGDRLLTSPGYKGGPVELPEEVISRLMEDGEWYGRLPVGAAEAYIYGKRLAPLPGMHSSLRQSLDQPGFLVVGIDMEKSLGAYAGFRKNVLFQGVYILAAVVFTWLLGVRYLARREQAGKAAALEQFQTTLLDNLPDGLITLTREGAVYSANPAALHILRKSSHELVGRPASELPPDIAACLEGGGGWQSIAFDRARLEVLALPLDNDPVNAWMLIIRDRTQLRRLEQSLAEAEKLAAVGTLAAGVAHEVRNPLSSLRGFAQYFVKKLAGKNPEEEYAKTMVREADRLNRVITDLLFLGRPKPIARVLVNLEEMLRDIDTLLHFDLENRRVRLDLRLDAPTAYADRDALKQALLNLLLNSLDALDGTNRPEEAPDAEEMPPVMDDGAAPPPALPDPAGGGPLRVRSGFVPEGAWPGGVYIDVQDLGCGMTRGQQGQAFEAFFTAKDHGTGLGLALVRRIMLDHGGDALIASAPGRGATVRLFFPGRNGPEGTDPKEPEGSGQRKPEGTYQKESEGSDLKEPSGSGLKEPESEERQ